MAASSLAPAYSTWRRSCYHEETHYGYEGKGTRCRLNPLHICPADFKLHTALSASTRGAPSSWPFGIPPLECRNMGCAGSRQKRRLNRIAPTSVLLPVLNRSRNKTSPLNPMILPHTRN